MKSMSWVSVVRGNRLADREMRLRARHMVLGESREHLLFGGEPMTQVVAVRAAVVDPVIVGLLADFIVQSDDFGGRRRGGRGAGGLSALHAVSLAAR